MCDEEQNTLFKCNVRGFHDLNKWSGGGVPSQTMDLRSTEQRESAQLEDFIRVTREVMQRELQEWCFDRKMSNSRLVQAYMSKQSGMDAQKVLQYQYSTSQTFYMTYLRESNDVLHLTTPRLSPLKKKKFSGGFRGVSALESED